MEGECASSDPLIQQEVLCWLLAWVRRIWLIKVKIMLLSPISLPACPAYGELMEVMNRATARLDLQWRHEKGEIARGRLDERFLSEHNRPAPKELTISPRSS